jgi:hypothetical protein
MLVRIVSLADMMIAAVLRAVRNLSAMSPQDLF